MHEGPPRGAFMPSAVMHIYSGKPMHLYSGVDTPGEERSELGLDVGLEGLAIHRTIEDPGGDQAVAAQAGNEGLGVPMAERSGHLEPLATGRAASQPRHVRGCAGLVEEDQAMRLLAHPRQSPLDPFVTPLGYVGATLFGGLQCFF